MELKIQIHYAAFSQQTYIKSIGKLVNWFIGTLNLHLLIYPA